MDDVARLGDCSLRTDIRQVLDILHNDFRLITDAPTWPNPVSRQIFVQELLLYFVYSTFISSPFQEVRTMVLLQVGRNKEKVVHKCAILSKINEIYIWKDTIHSWLASCNLACLVCKSVGRSCCFVFRKRTRLFRKQPSVVNSARLRMSGGRNDFADYHECTPFSFC